MATRSQRRAISRDDARRNAHYGIGYRLIKAEGGKTVRTQVGGRPRTVAADAQPECGQHHRKLPCGRCVEVA
jgi:hypothetical protein